jgi:sec-independent protein translocase protein TatC
MALLDRVLIRARRRSLSVEDSRMSLVEHLEALRRVLIVSFLAWIAATVISFFFWQPVFGFLLHLAHLNTVYFPNPTGAFMLGLKIAIYMGIVISSPVIIQQIWWFVSPGLHRHERRLVGPLILATMVFFLIGMGFALFSLNLILSVLSRFAPKDVVYFPFADDLLSFILALIIGFGIVFELPVILYVLGLLRIISTRWLYRNRAYWYLGLGLLANLLTPGADPLTPLIMFIPLLIFWEGTALLLKITGH